MSFINSIVVINHNSLAVPAAIYDFTVESGFAILFQFEVCGRFEFGEVDDVRSRDVFFELLDEVFEGRLADDRPNVGLGDAGLVVLSLKTCQTSVVILLHQKFYINKDS